MITISPIILPDGTVSPSQPLPTDAIKITFNGSNYIIYESGDTLPTIVSSTPQSILIVPALQALDASDIVVIRCYEHGVVVPNLWQAYRSALRNIVNGTDTTSTTLPTQPAYPQGT